MGLFALALAGVWLLLFIASSQSYTLEYAIFASEMNAGFTNQRSTEWNKNELHEEDVLFFGSSTCYSGIDPERFERFWPFWFQLLLIKPGHWKLGLIDSCGVYGCLSRMHCA